jgi:hypothetical protein
MKAIRYSRDSRISRSSLLLVPLLISLGFLPSHARTLKKTIHWTEYFHLDQCQLSSTGANGYFKLEPGYQLLLSGREGKDSVVLTVTVLNQTKRINNTETRVVEERETRNGKLDEVSRDYFAFCPRTSSVFYFGEDVDKYKKGQIVSHDGSWRADSSDAAAGLMMPGIILLGSRYYQELAPEVAMDRAQIISNSEVLVTPAGEFDNCLKIKETSPLKPSDKGYKLYAPGIGLIEDGNLVLVWNGFVGQ